MFGLLIFFIIISCFIPFGWVVVIFLVLAMFASES